MHTMWKGSISFGLVTIPIKLFAATENKDIKMRQLHKECHNPIKYEKVCPACEKTLEQDDIIKAYEYEPGKFVELEKDDLDALAKEQTKSIEIIDFVSLTEVDPIYFNRSYFIGPGENGGKPYTLLKQAMDDSGKIGIAKVMIRSKQNLAVVRVYDKGLLLETIHFPDEVRNVDLVPDIPENVEVNKKEMDMAIQLIDQLTTEFDPEKYHDDYREDLMEAIESKVKGEQITVSKERPKADVVDLMDALQASINDSKPKKKKKTTRKKKASSE
ncbi:Ku protein [Alkalihalobacillus sp. AL-G]|uniref:non-homologous end joining protein Ku n=1 Tax=Alkalihalobacillus sp. AL-G TaxID=2926399 RepID=UPI00272C7EB8|nr:Ku protein [Alkalihalobacillus sp. AL-G]WLD94869.1 Ku protein [Alkalihalobacillus sp. AL-G]